jgi:nucleotide-binding universal stress UspA family protein
MDRPYRENPHLLASAPVVVGADGSEGSELAVRWAAETAARRGRTLLIAHGLDIAGMRSMTASHLATPPSIIEALRARGTGIAAGAHRLAGEVAPNLEISTEISEASPSRLLIHLSKSAHLIALGATGNVGVFAHLGSTLLAVTSHGRGSIVVVRDTGGEPHIKRQGPVVVGVDGSPVSEVAIAAAFAEASERGAELVAEAMARLCRGLIMQARQFADLRRRIRAEELALAGYWVVSDFTFTSPQAVERPPAPSSRNQGRTARDDMAAAAVEALSSSRWAMRRPLAGVTP